MTDAVATTAAPADTAAAPAAPLSAASALTAAPAVATETAVPAAPAMPEGALIPPGVDATPEQWGEFYSKLGRPETPEAYEMEVPEGDDGAFAKQVAPLLHQAGITGEQAKVLSKGWNQMRTDAMATIAANEAAAAAAQNTQNVAEAATLKNEWGAQHEANMHFAQQAVKQFLPPDHASEIIAAIESKVGYRKTIEMLHGIGKGLGEHDAAGLGANGGANEKSLAQRMYPGLPAA